MRVHQGIILSVALVLSSLPASANTLYVVNNAQQFGTINPATGAFQPIGPGTPEGESGLVPGANGSLLTLTFSGNLDAIDPITGATTVIGATGLGNCTTGVPPQCGPNSASTIGALGGNIFATDFANNLYSVDSSSGHASLIGSTGIPAVPFIDGSQNPDGTINVVDADLFSAGGQLYEYFEALAINPFGPLPVVVNEVIAPDLYRVNPMTGAATLLGPAPVTFTAVANIGGTIYAFDGSQGDLVTLNLATRNANFVANLDPNAEIISGAVSTPEPTSIALTAIGIVALGIRRLRRHRAV
jgi:hypothetical protein